MKLIALAVALAGLLFLLILMHSLSPIEITPKTNLSSFQDNQKVILTGKVTKETSSGKSKILEINSVIAYCQSCPFKSYQGKNLSIEGIIDRFSGKTEIKALRLKLLN